jgi:hypothetical protein
VSCTVAYTAHADTCTKLLEELADGPRTWDPLPNDTTSVCVDQSDHGSDICCINWGNRIYNKGTYRELVNAGKAIIQGCQWGDYETKYVSGHANDVLIGELCTRECLSNEAGQCAV